MKKTKVITIILTLSLMLMSITACGGSTAKDDFKEYLNNNAIKVFLPESNEITQLYTEALNTQDDATILDALSDALPTKNAALLEKAKAYKTETTEVQELHNIFVNAVELRHEAYEQLLDAFTTNASDDSYLVAALDKLDESDLKFIEFQTKAESMKDDFGLVEAK